MTRSRRFTVVAIVMLGCAAIGAVAVGVARSRGLSSPNSSQSAGDLTLPKAVVDGSPANLGVVESPAEFHQTFAVRNEGGAPLVLTPGPPTCKCMTADVPESPIPPGGQAEVRVYPSEKAMKDEMKSGPLVRSFKVATNDPEHKILELVLTATVRCRLTTQPSPVSLFVHADEAASETKRTAQTVVYSQKWDRFDLKTVKTSREGLTIRMEPATPEALRELEATSGYRVRVTMPPDLADGPISEWVEFAGRSVSGGDASASLRLKIEGRYDGRVMFHGDRLYDGNRLRLGTVTQGTSVRQRVLMKINDEQRTLAVTKIETEPDFVRARVSPLANGTQRKGLYQVEVEIPADAPSCAFTGQNPATIRLKTDHPRLPGIDLKVDFVVPTGDDSPRLVAR